MKSESVEQVFLIYILPICFKSFLQVVLQTFYVLWIQKFELNMTRIKKKKKRKPTDTSMNHFGVGITS